MFNNFVRTIKSYLKIIRCRFSGEHKIQIVYLGKQRLRGCRSCDLWRYIPK